MLEKVKIKYFKKTNQGTPSDVSTAHKPFHCRIYVCIFLVTDKHTNIPIVFILCDCQYIILSTIYYCV